MVMRRGLPKSKRFFGKEVRTRGHSVTDRQERVPGFQQERLSGATVLLIGAGGLGGEVGEGLVRKGVGSLKICDADSVELTNLNRQRFYKKDIGKNKAIALGRNLVRECTCNTTITAYPYTFQRAVEEGFDLSCDVAFCGVDSDPTRVHVAEYFHKIGGNVVTSAVNREADIGYVFTGELGKACFACLFPNKYGDNREPCPDAGAVKDILKVVCGLALYAIDSLLMDRSRNWNHFKVSLAGFLKPTVENIQRRPDCPLCGGL